MKIKSLIAAAMLACFASKLHAAALQLPVSQDASGLYPSEPVRTPAMTGVLDYDIDAATPSLQAVQIPGTANQTGVVYAVYVSSVGTATAPPDAAVLIDSAPSNSGGVVSATTAANYNSNGLNHIGPEILSTAGGLTTCTAPLCGVWQPPQPVRFSNGLIIHRKGTSRVNVLYRLDNAGTLSTSAP